MLHNISRIIKGLAIVFAVAGIVVSVIVGKIILEKDFGAGIGVITGGSIGSWASSLALYGFGELIDKTASFEVHLKNGIANETEENDAIEEMTPTE